MNKTKEAVKFALRAAQGAAVGAGAILPGVSGGVLCVAFGVYEPMMALISHPIKSFPAHIKLFTPFLLGWLAGFFLLAKLLGAMFATAETVTIMLFLGLIAGTIPELMKKAELGRGEETSASWSPFVLSLVAAFILFRALNSGSVETVSPNLAWYVFSGAVWGLSLVVPGLSSSSILLSMGLYQPMTNGIAAFDLGVILPLLLGIVTVVALLARLINHLFTTRYSLVSKIILGVATASALSIAPGTPGAQNSFENAAEIASSAALFVLGFAAARFMDIVKNRNDARNT